jgi:hypothetical protein
MARLHDMSGATKQSKRSTKRASNSINKGNSMNKCDLRIARVYAIINATPFSAFDMQLGLVGKAS